MAESSNKGDILKVRLGNDTRRLVLYNTHISYDDLVLMLQRIYNGHLKSSDEVTLKYIDDDGDLITIADATDFAHAREYSSTGVVKMVVYVNGSDTRSSVNVGDIRKELAIVRDKVNSIVDSLDAVNLRDEQITGHTEHMTTAVETEISNNNPTTFTAVTEAISVFDPLKPSSDYSSVVTTTATPATQLPTTATNFVPVTSTGTTSHLFVGQSPSFFEPPSSGSQYIAQPTAPPPSSTPQPTQPYPPQTMPTVSTNNNNYTGGSYPYNSQYQQPTPTPSSSSPYPPPQGGQPQGTQQPPTASYAPYPQSSMYQGGSNYIPQGGQQQPPPGGRGGGYGPPRNSPYRIGY